MFWAIITKTIIVHTLTYFIIGLIAFKVFNYTALLADPTHNMRQATHPLVRAGALFQPVRGFLFGIVFYLLRDILFLQTNGWLIMWIMLIIVGIFSTFAAAPGSIEGFIYTKSAFGKSSFGLLEILSQSLLLSFITYYWVNHPEYVWLTWLLSIIFVMTLILPALGLLASRANRRLG